MRKISIISALLVLIFGLSTSALATPLAGSYSTSNGTLNAGFWYELFPLGPSQMGLGGSILTGLSDTVNPGSQWNLSMTSQAASPYSGGAPYGPTSASSWNWTTPYSGTITIGGSLTTGDSVGFTTNATNYNVTYNIKGDGKLEWVFTAKGTYNGYTMDVLAYYNGTPYVVSASPFKFGDLADNIQMTMVIAQTPVPEPATMMLLGSGLVGLWGFRKKFRK